MELLGKWFGSSRQSALAFLVPVTLVVLILINFAS
jgi:hypothetical protein